ncbi:glycosyltransferase [Sinorhizobium sp. GL28]|uniref:glycosyltransferase n=1 Tax=Sinorhizobium sp. GL28 TaxID=1358418 RepID=UPI0009EC2164|nr:glycosyltransferase [Sinorhizobium sp. GL28]
MNKSSDELLQNEKLISYLRQSTYNPILFSPRYKLLYVSTPKVACTSLKWWFASLEDCVRELRAAKGGGESDPDLVVHSLFWKVAPHVVGLSLAELLEACASPEVFRFAVVRNPYKRVFSAWQSKLVLREPLQIGPYRDLPFYNRSLDSWEDITEAFEGFVQHLATNEAPGYWDHHWRPQYDILRPDVFPYTKISQIENVEDLTSAISSWAGKGIPSPFEARRANESLIPYQAEFLSAESIRLIQELYAKDFDTFGYPYDAPTSSSIFSREQLNVALVAIESLRRRHQRLADQREEIQDLYLDSHKRNLEIERLSDVRTNLSSELQLKVEEVNQHRLEIEYQASQINNLMSELQVAADSVNLHLEETEFRANQIKIKDKEIAELTSELQLRELDINRHHSEIERQTHRIELQDNEIRDLTSELKVQANEISALQKHGEQLRAENRDLLTKLEKHTGLTAELDTLKKEVASHEASADAYRAENAELRLRITEARVKLIREASDRRKTSLLGLLGILRTRPRRKDVRAIRHSPLFDQQFYLSRYPDVAESRVDPAVHYLVHGWREGRDPSTQFSTLDYLDRHANLASIPMNPLLHYMKYAQGKPQSRVGNTPLLQDSFASDVSTLEQSDLFDQEFYLKRYPDVAVSTISAAHHYLVYGWHEGRDPSPHFHTVSYLEKHPDVAAAGINPLIHFLRYGRHENREIVQVDELDRASAGPAWTKWKRAKAVFVVHDLNIGGAPVLLANIARWFREHTTYDVRIVAMTGGPLSSVMEGIAPLFIVGTKDVSDNAIGDLRGRLSDFIGEEPAFTFINSVASGDYHKIDPYRAPVVAYIHEMPAILKMFDKQLRQIVVNSSHIFCGGAKVYNHLRNVENIDATRLSDIPAFIDQPQNSRLLSAEDKKISRERLGLNPDLQLVVGCGVAHWRKQPDVLVRMAAELLHKCGRQVQFVWVGDGEDIPSLRKLAQKFEVADLVHFVGHKENFRDYLEAADIFALTSSEDPFPLVCLEAALVGTPSVVFREATGMTVIIEPEAKPPAGLAVPLGDEQAFFNAVDRLLTNESLRSEMAYTARNRVLDGYVTRSGCAKLLSVIRRVANLRPCVSVIVPSFNCAPYLRQRLESIANQSFRDIEILLLDDLSTDNSREILVDFANSSIESKLFFAERNSGSVFKAWERGIELAQGDLIWLAEADDWCEPDFLHRAIAAFAQPGVRLVHGRSIPVNSHGAIAGDWNDLYLDAIAPGKWTRSFTSPAAKEVNEAYGRANAIPNASAVVTRRLSAQRAIRMAQHFRLAGDWAFYLTAIAGGRIAYCHEAVNYHRRHESSVTAGIEGKAAYFQELQNVNRVVTSLYGPNEDRLTAFNAHIAGEAKRFSWTTPLPEPQALEEVAEYNSPGVLYGVGDLSGGGAQMFAVRFVNRWSELPANAVLFITEHEPNSCATMRHVSPEIAIVTLADIEKSGGIANFMQDWGLNFVVSGHWWGDRAVSKLLAESPVKIPWIIAMHGCYENVLSSPRSFPTMQEDFKRAQLYADHWVWTAEKNKGVFEQGHIEPKQTSHIVNGFTPVSQFSLSRRELGIPDDALVFTLASRAIETKGWKVALAAFQELQKSRVARKTSLHLLLIGDGPVSDSLKSEKDITNVHFVQHTPRLADYIHISDVCLLPSWFAGESLPLVLIEFLAQGKPAIVSDIGMCAWAVGYGEQTTPAGFVVARDKTGKVPHKGLVDAMAEFVVNPELKSDLGTAAKDAFQKFDMDRMIDAYRKLAVGLLTGTEK